VLLLLLLLLLLKLLLLLLLKDTRSNANAAALHHEFAASLLQSVDFDSEYVRSQGFTWGRQHSSARNGRGREGKGMRWG
jgi:hypothetical protein